MSDQAAEPWFEVEDSLFMQEYGRQLQALGDRMWFAETNQGEPVGSISAWFQKEPPEKGDLGRIHWVVVHPDHQGRGISKAMMTVAMLRLAESHSAAVLGTSSGRPWAVKVYLDFGFRPGRVTLNESELRQAWIDVQSIIVHPVLAEWLGR